MPSPNASVAPTIGAVIPPLGFLPIYALLRSGPTKILGAALVPLLALLAALWPWRCAWRCHDPRTRLAFSLLWLGAGAGWIGLGFLGAQAPTGAVVAASQALAVYEFIFLAVVPLALARFVRPTHDGRAAVF